jgi:hypothetical protein
VNGVTSGEKMDLYTLMEKEDRRHNRGACPVCNVELALADIEGHVNRCLDLALQSDDEQLAKSLARSGYHPLAAAASASSPSAGTLQIINPLFLFILSGVLFVYLFIICLF